MNYAFGIHFAYYFYQETDVPLNSEEKSLYPNQSFSLVTFLRRKEERVMNRVLVIEDGSPGSNGLSKFLEDKGYEVVRANSNGEARAAYEREQPQMVLLYVDRPGADGIGTLRELKAHDPKANVIMVFGIHQKDVGKRAFAEGAFDYIVKPFDSKYLELSLKTMVLWARNN
jgi:DNA-binding NtrC family response regulator